MSQIHNADHGQTTVAQNIYEQSATALHKIGSRLVLGDRVFRYALAGASALIAGQLCESAAFGGSSATIQRDLVVATTGAVGSRTVVVTLATDAATLDQYADGYLTVYDGTVATGLGQCYKIKGNSVGTAGGNCTITLYDDIVVIITAGTAKVTLNTNPYKNVLISAATPVGFPVGVPLIAVTAAYYCWLQTWGPACVLVNGTVTLETALGRGTTTAGSVDIQAASALTNPIVGVAMQPAASTKNGVIWLQIAA